MGNVVILLDSNVLIYMMNGQKPSLLNWVSQYDIAVSDVTRIEILGYHRLSDQQKYVGTKLIEMSTCLSINDQVVQQAIMLKQQRAIKLGDSLIAATALAYHLPLATYNVSDFLWTGVKLIELPFD